MQGADAGPKPTGISISSSAPVLAGIDRVLQSRDAERQRREIRTSFDPFRCEALHYTELRW